MNKLFFDDVRDAPDETWDVARTVRDAMMMMKDKRYDIMSLDHDIGFQMCCDECYKEMKAEAKGPLITEETAVKYFTEGCKHMLHGTDLAMWMKESWSPLNVFNKWPSLILVHSANPYGAQRMMDILTPFTLCRRVFYNKEMLRNVTV